MKKVKFKLKGHESFYIREGWLRKGLKNVASDNRFFWKDDVIDTLGVGSNMVKSIRYWLQACQLTNERQTSEGRIQELTEDFGKLIHQYDPYFEDMFTLWLVHYQLVKNVELATAWHLFFNKFNVIEFTKEDMKESLKYELDTYALGQTYSETSLNDDCGIILKSYIDEEDIDKNPEDTLVCPLSNLGLIKSSNKTNYYKAKPKYENLDKRVVLYILVDNVKESNSISIDSLLNDTNNVGKVLNLDRFLLNKYLNDLKDTGYIIINKTAGLDMVYLDNKSKNNPKDIIKLYFEQK